MMEEDRMEIFLGSMDPGNSEFLEMLGEEALRASVPIIRRQTQSALRVLLTALRPEKILEIGCAVGFSAILMCENCNARITTIENYEKRIAPAMTRAARNASDNITVPSKRRPSLCATKSGESAPCQSTWRVSCTLTRRLPLQPSSHCRWRLRHG